MTGDREILCPDGKSSHPEILLIVVNTILHSPTIFRCEYATKVALLILLIPDLSKVIFQ